MEEAVSQLSHSRGQWGWGAVCQASPSRGEPNWEKEEEENKSIENRRSVVLYNHIHLAGKIGGSSEHFFGC